ncbi:MAG: Fic family protein [Gammaproteobacteria bacterium]|nr:Fic family protein [Gammaproteobacteria bacterium]MBU0785993.1 Fic family protein [Gammaproteobacteria bacterium]MBU0816606.1 Fic family protein [Gammaproteobacteria bacterium]MBU1788407.1 Fic family protein [Gammaproteobacteria bacterium]
MYTDPQQFEPLLPSDARMEPLLAKAHDLSRVATLLAGTRVPPELRSLLRSMNSYYTNRIEGQHTRPHEIDQALRKDFSKDATLAAKQRLAVAHIEAEAVLEQRYSGTDGARALYTPAAVQDLHRELFGRLPATDLCTPENEPVLPGALRTREVKVGQHVAPAHASVPRFLARWADFYGGVRRGEAALVAMAAAHHRLGWVHPFVDGNGRVMRLHTHALLSALGYTGGLWSPLRGFARSTERYYALLADADVPRRGDLDGRGNLSEQALIAWIDYVLDTCLDQVNFMASMLDFETMKARIEACLVFEATVLKSGVRQDSLRGLHYLFLSGEDMSRGDFKAMLGTSDRSATDALGALVKRGLLKTDTPQGKVRFGLPQHALRFLFPRLWPEAEADAAAL